MTVALRPFAVSDTERLHAAIMSSFDELRPWMPWCHPGYAPEETREWLKGQVEAFQAQKEFGFAVVDGADEILGSCGLNAIDPVNRRANLGYWIRTSATRRGVGTRAVRALADWAFGNTELFRLEIHVAVGNVPSQRVAEKAGATREGVLRSRLVLHGALVDAVLFSILRSDAP